MDEAVAITAKFLNVPEGPLSKEAKLAKLPSSKELEDLTRSGKVDAWFDTLAQLYADFGKIKDPLRQRISTCRIFTLTDLPRLAAPDNCRCGLW